MPFISTNIQDVHEAVNNDYDDDNHNDYNNNNHVDNNNHNNYNKTTK